VTYPAIVLAIGAAVIMPDADVSNALFGGLLAGGILLLPALLTGGVGMGMGDVKLAFFTGLAVGLELVPVALLVMAISGGLAAGGLLLSRKRTRGEPIPYAPYISCGALVTLLGLGSAFARLS
jgi:leader peptidase (prepilin peptidase)/N-methyltransferase